MATLGIDLEAGAHLLRAEMYGDWYRDPWAWPELEPANIKDLDIEEDLGVRATSGEYHLTHSPRFHVIEVPKSWLGVRPAVVLDPLSRLLYGSAVLSGLDVFCRSLPEWVCGWRSRESGTVERNSEEWQRYVADLPERGEGGMGLQSDITSFFASVSPQRLRPIVVDSLGRVAATNVIMDVVEGHDSLLTRNGLPQRSYASAILANAYLRPIDDVLAAALPNDGVKAVRRWMDDISAEGSEDVLYKLLMQLQDSARQIGLELNSAKTHLLDVDRSSESLHLDDLREIEVPLHMLRAGYDEVPEPEFDTEVLRTLEEQCLMTPQRVPRTILRAVLASLSKYGEFSRLNQWLQRAHYLPHVADSLGRYLRSAGEVDPDLVEEIAAWFRTFESSPWNALDWVSAQAALAFSSSNLPSDVRVVLVRWLRDSMNLQKVSISCQKLAVTDPTLCRTLIRARVDHTDDPQIIRAFALGGLAAGETTETVKALLMRDHHNHLLLRWLDKHGWRAPSAAIDFDPMD